MGEARIDTRVFFDPSWWHWALTVPLLAAYLGGVDAALIAAMVLCAAMAVFFWARVGRVRPMPVQVRIAYLALLAIGAAPWMAWIHWVQLVGTSAMVVFGYCPLVRMLTLLPWNRSELLGRAFLKRLAFSPSPGGLWGLASSEPAQGAACSCTLAAAPAKRAVSRQGGARSGACDEHTAFINC